MELMTMQGGREMELMTIGEVSSRFRISARMLRYYEKEGLVKSTREEGYAYRMYEPEAVKRIQQIIILRKLQIPVKQIRCMMEGNREEAVSILKRKIRDLDESEASLHTMKKGLEKLVKLLCEDTFAQSHLDCIQECSVVEFTNSLPLEKHHLKEERKTSVAKEMVEKGKCVRIVQLPPCTVAAYQFTGKNPEEAAGEVMDRFIRSVGLYEKKPDARLFGFNNCGLKPESETYGYEEWVTIPDDMEVAAPLVKKHFKGGLYAAYTIDFPDFHEWDFVVKWAKENEIYQADYREGTEKNMGGCMEEYRNSVYSSHMGWPENGIDGQVDLLIPVKRR